MRIARVVLWAVAVAGVCVGAAVADPLPGEFLKFQQLPMDGTKINRTLYYGHDEPSTAWASPGSELPIIYQGNFMADDFADVIHGPVVHVRWWGSYFNDPGMPDGRVKKFLISFEKDVPAGVPGPDGAVYEFSRPGPPILSQIVTLGDLKPGSGTFTEKWISPGGDPLNEALFEYNAELRCPFKQEADTVYWLKIVALANPQQDINWGWHNRDYTRRDIYASGAVLPGEKLVGRVPDPEGTDSAPIWHFQDDAVSGRVVVHEFPPAEPCQVYLEQPASTFTPQYYVDGADGPGPYSSFPGLFPGIAQYSKDLAFELYTIPEPSTITLVGIGLASLIVPARRRRR